MNKNLVRILILAAIAAAVVGGIQMSSAPVEGG